MRQVQFPDTLTSKVSSTMRHTGNSKTEHAAGQMLCLIIGCGSRRYDLYIFLQCLSTHYLQDTICVDPDTHGSMVVPLLLGSDKTLVSNTTGQNEFHPLYLSLGNIKNTIRRAHQDAVIPIGFLAIPKSFFFFSFQVIWIRSHMISSRHTKRWNKYIIQIISVTAAAPITKGNSQFPSPLHDQAECRDVPRRPPLTSSIHAWTLHCRLPRASVAGCHRQWMVHTVSIFIHLQKLQVLMR